MYVARSSIVNSNRLCMYQMHVTGSSITNSRVSSSDSFLLNRKLNVADACGQDKHYQQLRAFWNCSKCIWMRLSHAKLRVQSTESSVGQ